MPQKKSKTQQKCLGVILALSFLLAGCAIGSKDKTGGSSTEPPVLPKTPAQTERVVVYFADEQAMHLKPEFRDVEIGSNLPLTILQELVKGPGQQGHYRTLPATTRILSLEVKQNIAYVNLSQDFEKDYPGGTTGEAMALGSIINSLTELENIYAVQFLIEGKTVEVLAKGHVDLTKPLERHIFLK